MNGIPKNTLSCVRISYRNRPVVLDVFCIVETENEYGYTVNIVAIDTISAIHKNIPYRKRWLNEPLSKGIIKQWRIVPESEAPLCIGMSYTSPLLDKLLAGESL